MPFLWIALAAVALLALLYWRRGKPRVHRAVPLADLSRFVESLVARFVPGAVLLADRRPPPGFLQLALRSIESDEYTLEFGFPEIDWSRAAFNRVLAAVEADGFEPATDIGFSEVLRFMRVQISAPAPEICERVQRLFSIVVRELEWGEGVLFDVRLLGRVNIPGRRSGRSDILPVVRDRHRH